MEIKNQDQQDVGLNSTGELNLYLDLLAFSELSTEEQLAHKERLKVVSSEQVLEDAGEFPGFVETTDSEVVLSSDEPSGPFLESPTAFAAAECDPLAPLEPTEMSEPVFEFLPAAEQPSPVEPAREALPSENTEPPASSVGASDLFRASGPLSITGFLFDPTSKAAPQVMALAVCVSCGSETDDEDLFCVECGAFMDERGYTELTGSACDDCGLIVTTGELICPACGSVSVVC
jgi:RNA polymerase subunit RPABC4/transcription elongation factor Spt4